MAETEPITDNITEKSETSTPQIWHRKQLRARVEDLEQQVGSLTAEVEAERDKRLRLAAEYDNYRRRTNQEYRLLAETAGERILLKLLPVIDDFERLMAHQDAEIDSLRQGTEMIYRKLQALFESEGVAAIPSIGTSFDAGLHEAVAQAPLPNAENGTIVAEVERGYRLREKIIRHAKVIVAQSEGPAAEADRDQNG